MAIIPTPMRLLLQQPTYAEASFDEGAIARKYHEECETIMKSQPVGVAATIRARPKALSYKQCLASLKTTLGTQERIPPGNERMFCRREEHIQT